MIESIVWARKLDVVTIRPRIGYIPAYLVHMIEESNKGIHKITVGFSEDKQTMYIKLSDKGVLLSDNRNGRGGRTFSIRSLLVQFGSGIIGKYRAEDTPLPDGTFVFKKID